MALLASRSTTRPRRTARASAEKRASLNRSEVRVIKFDAVLVRLSARATLYVRLWRKLDLVFQPT